MSRNPLISVVIPVYNRKTIILEAINSVLQQEPKNYEIIAVDDGSTDGTTDYLESLKLPIQIIKKENGGISSARNVGIKIARGEYIAFLDSDDLWLVGILEAQVEYLKAHPNIPLVYTDQFIESNGKRLEKTRFQRANVSKKDKSKFNLPGFVQFIPIHASSVMAKKSLFDEVGMFNEDLQIHEDTEFWNRVSEKYNLGYIDKSLAIFRWEKDPEHSLNTASRKKFISEGRKYMQIYEQRHQQKGLTSEEKQAIRESYKRLDKLEMLVSLQEKGKITEEEFDLERRAIFK